MFWRVGEGLDREGILKKFSIDATGTNFAYRSVGDAFRMIESGLLPVIVPGDEAARKAIADLDNPPFLPASSPGNCKVTLCRSRLKHERSSWRIGM